MKFFLSLFFFFNNTYELDFAEAFFSSTGTTFCVAVIQQEEYQTSTMCTSLMLKMQHRHSSHRRKKVKRKRKRKHCCYCFKKKQQDANCPLSLMWRLALFHSTSSHLFLSGLKYLQSPMQTFGNCRRLITRPSGPQSVSMTPPTPPSPSLVQGLKSGCLFFSISSSGRKKTKIITPIVSCNRKRLNWINFPRLLPPWDKRKKEERDCNLWFVMVQVGGLLKFFLPGFSLERCLVITLYSKGSGGGRPLWRWLIWARQCSSCQNQCERGASAGFFRIISSLSSFYPLLWIKRLCCTQLVLGSTNAMMSFLMARESLWCEALIVLWTAPMNNTALWTLFIWRGN